MIAQDEADPFADLRPHTEALDALFNYLDLKAALSFRKPCRCYARSTSRLCQALPQPDSRCKSHGGKSRGRIRFQP